jgi:hypothetical protein
MKGRIAGLFLFLEAAVTGLTFTLVCSNSLHTHGSGCAAEHPVPALWGTPTLEFARSRNIHENLSGSLGWGRRTNHLAFAIVRYHNIGFVFVGYVKDPVQATRVSDLPTLRDSILNVTAPVGQDTASNWAEA